MIHLHEESAILHFHALEGQIMLTVPTITIAIISRHHVVSLGLQKMLENRATLRTVVHPHQTMTPEMLLPENHPDIFILDIETERAPIDVIRQMREAAPHSKILLLSGFEDRERLREAVDYGVDGVILKIQPPKVLLAAIDELCSPIDNHISVKQDIISYRGVRQTLKMNPNGESQPAVWPEALTEREREVIRLVGQGLSNKDIAYQLSISDSTVRHHLTSIFDKVGVPNRQKLLIHAHNVHSSVSSTTQDSTHHKLPS